MRPDASDEELKAAYRSLVKKYHPDRYANSPMQEQAQEKLKEINLAYDTIVKQRERGSQPFQGGFGGGRDSGWSDTGGSERFSDIRQMISRGLIAQAETALEQMRERPAEWHFLRGVVYMRRGWFNQAQSCFDTAATMEPDNQEYASAAERGQSGFQGARQWNMGGMQMNSAGCRSVCAILACSSLCCGGRSFFCC